MVEFWAEQLRNWSWDLEPVVEAAGSMEDHQLVSEKEEQTPQPITRNCRYLKDI